MAKMRPKMAKMRLKMAKMRPKMAKMRLKMAKMRLKLAKMAKMRPNDGQDEARSVRNRPGTVPARTRAKKTPKKTEQVY